MHLTDQTRADGEALEPLEPGLHRSYVVDDLLDVRSERQVTGFCVEDLGERGLGALDPGRGDGLSAEVGTDDSCGCGSRRPAPASRPRAASASATRIRLSGEIETTLGIGRGK